MTWQGRLDVFKRIVVARYNYQSNNPLAKQEENVAVMRSLNAIQNYKKHMQAKDSQWHYFSTDDEDNMWALWVLDSIGAYVDRHRNHFLGLVDSTETAAKPDKRNLCRKQAAIVCAA